MMDSLQDPGMKKTDFIDLFFEVHCKITRPSHFWVSGIVADRSAVGRQSSVAARLRPRLVAVLDSTGQHHRTSRCNRLHALVLNDEESVARAFYTD
jgi:hypothetical protein